MALEIVSRFFAVSGSLFIVVVLEVWYLLRQLTSTSSSRQAKKKFTVLPDGVAAPPPKLHRTASSLSTRSFSNGTANGDLTRTASTSSTSTASALRSNSTKSLPNPLVARGDNLSTGIGSSSGEGLASLAAMSKNYSTESTSSGFGTESLLVSKFAAVVVGFGALWYFPWWLLLLAIGVLLLARNLAQRRRRQAELEEEEAQIAIEEIPRSGSIKRTLTNGSAASGTRNNVQPLAALPSSNAEGFFFFSFLFFFSLLSSACSLISPLTKSSAVCLFLVISQRGEQLW